MELLRRLERLPMSRAHLRLLAMGGLGYTFDAADLAIVDFLLVFGINTTGKTLEPIAAEDLTRAERARVAAGASLAGGEPSGR